MTDTPMPDWVLLEAAKRCGWDRTDNSIEDLQYMYSGNSVYAPLCDMILKYEQPPAGRKLLCALQAYRSYYDGAEPCGLTSWISVAVSAIELWEEGFGK